MVDTLVTTSWGDALPPNAEVFPDGWFSYLGGVQEPDGYFTGDYACTSRSTFPGHPFWCCRDSHHDGAHGAPVGGGVIVAEWGVQ